MKCESEVRNLPSPYGDGCGRDGFRSSHPSPMTCDAYAGDVGSVPSAGGTADGTDAAILQHHHDGDGDPSPIWATSVGGATTSGVWKIFRC